MKVFKDKLSNKPNGVYELFGTRLVTKGWWIFAKTITEQYKLGDILLTGVPGTREAILTDHKGTKLLFAIDICDNVHNILVPGIINSWEPIDDVTEYIETYRKIKNILFAADYIQ